jgi:hypothetical protein
MNGITEGTHWNTVEAVACPVWALLLALGRIAIAPAQATAPGGAPPPGSASPALTITVRVYNYAQIPEGILRAAERETARIFSETGVETLWVECRVSRTQPQSPACKQPFSSSDLVLRLLPPHMAGAVPSYADTFGIALTGKDRPGTDAIIFYGRVAELSRSESLYTQDTLPAVMAHEIGHLLLDGGHSPTGLMRAKWDREELKLAERRQLEFTPEQSVLIRKEVAARRAHADGRTQ